MGYASCLEDASRRLDDIRHDLSTLRQDLGSSSQPGFEESRLDKIASATAALVGEIDKLLDLATDPSIDLSDSYLRAQRDLEQQMRVSKRLKEEGKHLGEVNKLNEERLRDANNRMRQLKDENDRMSAMTRQMTAAVSELDARAAQMRLDISQRDHEIQALQRLVMPAVLAGADKTDPKVKFR